MRFKTKISKITEKDVIIRDRNLSELVERNSFSDAIFLILGGRFPTDDESKLFSRILVSSVDHGMGTTSSMATRFVMSSTHQINSAVAAGISSLGKFHGGAIERAMKHLKKIKERDISVEDYVKLMINKKKVIYGFGHKIHKEADPRVSQLIDISRKLDVDHEHLDLAIDVEREIEIQKNKKLILNIDGFIAAALLDLGFLPEEGNGIFIIARTPGLVTQAIEERLKEKPVRRVDEDQIEYLEKDEG